MDVDTYAPPPTRPTSSTAATSITTTSTVTTTTIAVVPSTTPQTTVPSTQSAPVSPTTPDAAPGEPVYYENCSAARAAGAAPVYAGQSGYGRHIDRDGDGIGCE